MKVADNLMPFFEGHVRAAVSFEVVFDCDRVPTPGIWTARCVDGHGGGLQRGPGGGISPDVRAFIYQGCHGAAPKSPAHWHPRAAASNAN